MKKPEAVVFDMDGILMDSEHLWRKAEISVFAGYGVHLSDEDCKKWMGIRTDEVVRQIISDFRVELPAEKITGEIIESVCSLILSEGKTIRVFCDLAIELKAKGIPLAIATSSPMRVVHAVLQRTGLQDVFDAIVSAEKFPYGKPHPQVYIEACAALGKKPVDCLAIEDSLNGTLSAKAARMKAVAIPEPGAGNHKGFGIADFVAESPVEAAKMVSSLF